MGSILPYATLSVDTIADPCQDSSIKQNVCRAKVAHLCAIPGSSIKYKSYRWKCLASRDSAVIPQACSHKSPLWWLPLGQLTCFHSLVSSVLAAMDTGAEVVVPVQIL